MTKPIKFWQFDQADQVLALWPSRSSLSNLTKSISFVGQCPSVRDELFSEMAHSFFLIFFMKLGVYTVTSHIFQIKIPFVQIWAKRAPKIGFLEFWQKSNPLICSYCGKWKILWPSIMLRKLHVQYERFITRFDTNISLSDFNGTLWKCSWYEKGKDWGVCNMSTHFCLDMPKSRHIWS